jgi:3-hydroxyisobutyrate dehydrogenase-like beta-hydroxyacid dehydrogenase
MKVGFVGLGVMGGPMACNIVRRGFTLRAYDTDPEKRRALQVAGAETVQDVAELAGWADAIIFMLPGPKQIRATALEVKEYARPGAIVLDMSTSDPALDQEMATALGAKGIRWIDAPVSRAVPAAVDGTLLTMVGGDPAVLETVRPLLSAMATDIVHVGPVGSGHVMKLLNNLKIMAEVALMAEVVKLGVRSGIPAATVDKILRSSSADSFMWRYQVPRMVTSNFVPGFSVDHGYKDLTLADEWAKHLDMKLTMGSAAKGLFERAQHLGYGAEDTAVLVKIFDT